MKKSYAIILLVTVLAAAGIIKWGIGDDAASLKKQRLLVDTRVDNNKYWQEMAAKGLATLNPEVKVKKAVYTGSRIIARTVKTLDSPDVPVTEENSTQSENSVFINPKDFLNPLVSNNSTENPVGSLYGANDLYSFDGGETWDGELEGAGTSNSGDPSTAISNDGRYYVGYISNSYGQGVSYSDDQGQTWTPVLVAGPGNSQLLDKNHMWIDNSLSSPYEGNLYNAWGPLGGFGHVNENEIEVSVSSDDGLSWSAPVGVSQAVNAGSHNQGINLSTGPNGEVYAVWAIYDSWPSDESALGFAKSYDGGQSWEPATRIIENIRGIRTSGTAKDMRVNSFPVATVDISEGPHRGNIYVVWANIGVPGANAGPDIDIYIIKSSDEGETWSDPIRVNQDEPGNGNQHYLPWITCDPDNGALSAVFYDDRNTNSSECEVFCANSFDGGQTWEDFKVSDVAFLPLPIPGLAQGYFGDYLGISAYKGMVYPVWTDNRSGVARSYTSPYETNPLAYPLNLLGDITFETGAANLYWEFGEQEEFDHFNIYRDNELIGSTSDTFYVDNLPDYGRYRFMVTAAYTGGDESIPASIDLQWGDAHIAISPSEINQVLKPADSALHNVTIYNIGELQLNYTLSPLISRNTDDVLNYCAATTEYCDEYISRVQLGNIDQSSGCNNYEDFTDVYTEMHPGNSYPITITNGVLDFPTDQCAVWIDWNQDEVFDDNESIDLEGTPGIGPYTGEVSPPSTAVNGYTRMRVRINYSGTPEPCGTTLWGEVEDYSILVSNWLKVGNYGGEVNAGDSLVIPVELNASDLDVGLYQAQLLIECNDPEVPEMSVPVNLLVTDFEVSATAENTIICQGAAVNANADTANVYGDTVLYEWTSIPEGYYSQEKEPVFDNVQQPTYFIVKATDQLGAVYDTLEIDLHEQPTVELLADTSICAHLSIELDAGANTDYDYLWMDGSSAHNMMLDSLGYGIGTINAWVQVTNSFSCSTTDSVKVTFVDCTGIEELSGLKDVVIYPNPGDGIFNVQITAKSNSEWNLRVINQSGRQISEKKYNIVSGEQVLKFDMSSHAPGTYYLLMENNNKMMVRKKFIIR